MPIIRTQIGSKKHDEDRPQVKPKLLSQMKSKTVPDSWISKHTVNLGQKRELFPEEKAYSDSLSWLLVQLFENQKAEGVLSEVRYYLIGLTSPIRDGAHTSHIDRLISAWVTRHLYTTLSSTDIVELSSLISHIAWFGSSLRPTTRVQRRRQIDYHLWQQHLTRVLWTSWHRDKVD
jgi:hypothetical protein